MVITFKAKQVSLSQVKQLEAAGYIVTVIIQ